jgi:hypothetical protein
MLQCNAKCVQIDFTEITYGSCRTEALTSGQEIKCSLSDHWNLHTLICVYIQCHLKSDYCLGTLHAQGRHRNCFQFRTGHNHFQFHPQGKLRLSFTFSYGALLLNSRGRHPTSARQRRLVIVEVSIAPMPETGWRPTQTVSWTS